MVQDAETGEAHEVMVQQDGETEGEQLTATITGLDADTQYRVSVRAKNNRPKAKGKNLSEYISIAARTASMLYCFPSDYTSFCSVSSKHKEVCLFTSPSISNQSQLLNSAGQQREAWSCYILLFFNLFIYYSTNKMRT